MRLALWVTFCGLAAAQDRPFHEAELVFPLEKWHNHASTIVELPGGDEAYLREVSRRVDMILAGE